MENQLFISIMFLVLVFGGTILYSIWKLFFSSDSLFNGKPWLDRARMKIVKKITGSWLVARGSKLFKL